MSLPSRACRCGEPVTSAIYLRYRLPREQFLPEAMDPWYVNGSSPASTCGAPGCEAEAYAALFAEHPGALVAIETEPGGGIFVAGDDE